MMLKDDPLYHPRRKAEWYKRTRTHNLRRMQEWRRSLHDKALNALGDRCACCGETRNSMLDIDHVAGGGNMERRADLGNNFKLYQRIRDGLVKLGIHQILCSNCNNSKRRNCGLCEHYTERWAHWLMDDAPDPGPYPYRMKVTH